MNLKKIREGAKHYLVDTTGLLLASTPIYAAMETLASGMSVDISYESRLKVALIAYSGLGIAYAKGRDFSKKIFGIDKNATEGKHGIHDSLYATTFNIILSAPIYLSSGADLEQALKGTAGACILGLVSGPINGYSIDLFRDFIGTKKSTRRIPSIIKNANQKAKKLMAAGMICGMLLGTSAVYTVKEKYFPKTSLFVKSELNPNGLERIVLD